jgi:hypothetical protein
VQISDQLRDVHRFTRDAYGPRWPAMVSEHGKILDAVMQITGCENELSAVVEMQRASSVAMPSASAALLLSVAVERMTQPQN